MADIMDIDSILEDDLLDALGGTSEVASSNTDTIEPEIIKEEVVTDTSESINLDSSNIDTIASLLKELLNNKTIEITIKIK